MSLIHWWPLNGDTQDKIGNIKLTGTFTSNVSGKIGSCAQQNSARLTASTTSLTNLKSFSVAMWVKFSSTASTAWCDLFGFMMKKGTTTDSMRAEVTSNGGSSFSVFCNSISGSSGGYANFSLNKDVWTHLVFIKDGGTVSTYKNGVLSGTNTLANFVDAYATGEFHIGDSNFYSAYNDVRIFDHVLSQAEVKELSKALVMHYTFDDILSEPTTNVSTINGWNSYTSYFVISERTETGLKVYRPTNSTRDILALSNSAVTGKMAAGEIWTFSCFLYVDGKPYKCTCPDMSTYNYSGISYYSNDHGYYTCTFRVGSPETWIIHASMFDSVGTNVMCEIDKIQFEKKNHATPYVNGTRESLLVDESGLSETTVKDNIVLSTDSASGQYSLKCSNTWIKSLSNSSYQKDITLAAWVKPSDYSGDCIIIGGCYLTVNGGGKLSAYCYGKDPAGYHTGTTVLTTGVWHHIAVVWDGSYCIGYINGVQEFKVASTGSANTSNHTKKDIGAENGSTRKFNGLIDDARVYHTALSANDIAELYKTKAYITDKGDIEAHEFIEKTENIITEAGFAIPAKSTAGNGKIEMRNGVMAYGLQANTYYYANDPEASNAIFKGKFKSNTQYYFDLFMDVDTMWYSGGSKYVPGGFVLRYTDGTTVEINATSTNGANGWKRVQFYSRADKTIYGLGVYYYIGTKWYLRHDSGIYEMDKDNAQVTEKYTVETTQVTETSYQTNALIHSSGNIVGREIIEI